MDDITGLCIGCFRTLAEITAWSRTDDMGRANILVSVNKRRQEPSRQADKFIACVEM